MAFLTQSELESMGFKVLGENVQISDKASIYGAEHISLADNCRIDDFCVIEASAGEFTFCSYVHIACYSSVMGDAPITFEDFSALSPRVSVYSSDHDYSGDSLTNLTLPDEFKNVKSAPVVLRKHAVVGAGSVILPGVTLGTGCAVAAMSLVNHNCDDFGVYGGIPAKKLKERSHKLLEVETEFIQVGPHSYLTPRD